MLKCPECEKEFQFRGPVLVKYLFRGTVACPRCHVLHRFESRHGRSTLILKILRVGVVFGFSLNLVLFAVFLLNSWALSSSFWSLSTAGFINHWGMYPMVLSQVLMTCSFLGNAFFLRKPRYELLPVSVRSFSDICPVCREEPPADAIVFGGIRVCPQCKELYAQQLHEGVADP